MAKRKKEFPIRFDGSDSDFFHFSTPSWTNKGVRYDLHVCKRTGIITCDCKDSKCRHKSPSLVEFLQPEHQERACKHQRLLRASYLELLEA